MPSRLIFIASHISPPHTGGEIYNMHLLAAAERAGITVQRVALSDSPVDRWLCAHRGVWRLRRTFAFFRMLGLIWHYRYAHVMFDAWLTPLLWPAIRLLRPPYFVMVHHLCADLRSHPLARRWEGFCERQLLARACHILTVSQSSKRQIESRTGGAVPVGIVNPGFESRVETRTGGRDELRLLFVGKSTRAKGVVDLVQAVSGLPQTTRWRLDIVGSNKVEPATIEEVRSICHRHDLEGRVMLHGQLDDASLKVLYASSDIFVLPSYWEGYGIVLLEAMSYGLAVVASDAGAIPEVVKNGHTGLLVPPGNIEALKTAISRLLTDAALRQELAANGLAFIKQHHDWDGMEEKCMAWWHSVMEGSGEGA
jgi:glycosyltransferase involved in cell wall biosynthesis